MVRERRGESCVEKEREREGRMEGIRVGEAGPDLMLGI